MSRLKAEPPEPVRSLDELFAIAHAMEQEAASRYEELAEQMHRLGNPDVAAVFAHLAEEERGHVASVDRWSRQRTGAVPDPADRRWMPPETFDQQAAEEMGSSRLATAYRALSMAVQNEERAFSFWSYVAAQAEQAAVRQAAERMAQEELAHAWLLRRERRRAFHTERRSAQAVEGRQEQRVPSDEEATHPVQIERELAARLRDLAVEHTAGGRADAAQILQRLALDSDRIAEEIAATDTPFPAAPEASSRPDEPGRDRLQAALRLAELAIERYMGAAEAAGDEAAIRQAQSLAQRAIARFAKLEGTAGEARGWLA